MEEGKEGGVSDEQFKYFKTMLDHYPDVNWTFLLVHKLQGSQNVKVD